MITSSQEVVHLSHASDTTKANLISAAERLFAEHGVDAVSLRQINRASGARNAVAVQYHFSDREGMVRAVLAKHWPAVDIRRHALLDDYEHAGRDDLRSLAGALVRPSATKLADPDGGRAYLQISAYLINRPDPLGRRSRIEDNETEAPDEADTHNSIKRWRMVVEPLLDPEATRLHRRFNAIRFAEVELGRRAAAAPRTEDSLFVSHLVDMVAAILAAPVSGETLGLAAARDRARAPGRNRAAGRRA